MSGSTHQRPPFIHTPTSYHPNMPQSSSMSINLDNSSVISLNTPYRDYPPEKSESNQTGESSGSPSAESHNYRQQNNPTRGIYGYRRSPIQLPPPESPSRWRTYLASRFCKEGNGGGRLGKALILGWVITTLMFVVATAFWKGELFTALDQLSTDLREMGYQGQAIFGFLIFLTTIPPLPLYSTLMVLSGYTFGATQGFLISYFASLIGAVLVFVGSRTLLRDCITKCLSSSPTSMSLLQIIPSRPDLLLLIRIAPYPYNLLNVVLASAQGLSLKTYTGCTAISLLKVILHTWFGSGIHDLSELHSHRPPPPGPPPHHHHNSSEEPHHNHGFGGHEYGHPHPPPPGHYGDAREDAKFYGTWGGIVLCLILFVYLHHIAKKALLRAQAEAERDGRIEEGGGAGGQGQGLVEVRTVN